MLESYQVRRLPFELDQDRSKVEIQDRVQKTNFVGYCAVNAHAGPTSPAHPAVTSNEILLLQRLCAKTRNQN